MHSSFMNNTTGSAAGMGKESNMAMDIEMDSGETINAQDKEMIDVVVVDDENGKTSNDNQDLLRNYLLLNKSCSENLMASGTDSDEGKRKLSKPMIEKRRRERMNKCLDYLKQMVIDSKQSVPFLNINKSRFEKADILEITVQYIIGKQYAEHQQQLRGFDLCFNELGKFMLDNTNTDDEDTAEMGETGLHTQLKSHLSLSDSSTSPKENKLLALFKQMCAMRDKLSYECEMQRQHAASLVSNLIKKEMTRSGGSKMRSNSMSDESACSTPTAYTEHDLLPEGEKEFLGKLYQLYHETEVPRAAQGQRKPVNSQPGVIRHTNQTEAHHHHGKPIDLTCSASSTCSSSSSSSSTSSTHSSYSSSSLSSGSLSSYTCTHKSPFFTEPKNGFWPRFGYDSYASASGNERNNCYDTLWKPYEP